MTNEWYAKNISRKVRSSKKLRGNADNPMCPPPYGYKKDPNNPRKWIIDDEAAEVVRRTYRLCIEGKGIETTARMLQEDGILTPTQYWESKGIRKGGKKTQDTPCKWCKTTITKILTLPEYTGTLINFKTYSKSFKNKRRLINPEENRAVFENHHEASIDTATWEQVQKLREGTNRRKPKNTEKNMFAGLLYCADCGHKLHYNINHPNSSIEYFNCSNYRGNRGTCNETHYIRADSLEQVVLLELNRMVSYLKHHAEEFAELLAQKTTKDYERESWNRRRRLQELTARNKEVDRLFERIYEDRVLDHLSVEQFQTLSGGYTEEQTKLSQDIPAKESAIQKLRDTVSSTDGFIAKAKRYTDITELTPEPLRLFIQKIVVYEKSTKWSKHVLQTIEIHYNDIGCVGGNKQRDKENPRQEISA